MEDFLSLAAKSMLFPLHQLSEPENLHLHAHLQQVRTHVELGGLRHIR
jgi:hypothetical protein